MDFRWAGEQECFKADVIAFAKQTLGKDAVSHDRNSEFPRDDWNKCAEFGIQSLSVPAAFSGRENQDFLSAMLAMEGLGYACPDNGLCFSLNAQIWTVQLPIVEFGTDAQKQRFLPDFCSGKIIGAHAISEEESGSDVFAMTTRAEKTAGGYLLNGVKRYVSLAPIADLYLVFATIDPSLGKWGITAFLVESDRPGATLGPERHKMGLRSTPMSDLILEDCLVPEENRLGAEGAGLGLSTWSLEWERCCILASQLGAMERQLEDCIAFARKRRQFNQPISKFQAVSHRMVEMRLRLETSRLLLYKVAWLKQMGRSAQLEASLLKLHLSECFAASSLDAVRIHGGQGYMTDGLVERDLRDAVGGLLYAGTSDIQRNIVAALMGL